MRYGRVFTSFWTSPDLAGLDLQTKAIGAYLLSSPHGNMVGCFRLPIAYAMEDLRSGSETVLEGFRNLSGVGFIEYDAALSWMLIRRFLIWNPIENPNQGKAAAKLVGEVPRASSVYAALVDILRLNPGNFPEGFVNGLETVPQPYRNPEPYPYPEPYLNPEQKDTSPSAPAGKPAESPPAKDPPRDRSEQHSEKAAIGRLFHFYCEALGKDPARYTLTTAREKKALMRLQERRHMHGGDLQAAERDLSQAIENLAASEWHRANGHIDWTEQIFRSAEEFEKRLTWTQPQGETANGNRNFESRYDRAEREAAELLRPRHAGGIEPEGTARS